MPDPFTVKTPSVVAPLRRYTLGVPCAHLLGDPLAGVVVAVRRGDTAPGERNGEVLRVVADRRERVRRRRGQQVAVGIVGEAAGAGIPGFRVAGDGVRHRAQPV